MPKILCNSTAASDFINMAISLINEYPTEGQLQDLTKKTASIDLESIKDSDGWYGLAVEFGIPYEKISNIFEYGESADLTIEVDEDLNIVGRKIHPFKNS